MKTFKQYLQESKQTYTFRIKLANEIANEDLDRIERHLAKYDVVSVSAPKKLMLQSAPYDFPQLRGYEIHVVEFVTNLPASAYQIQTEIQNLLCLSDGFMKVRSDKEPLEQQEHSATAEARPQTESLLADAEYKDADKVDGSEYFGDKYNTKFVQELLKLRKEKEKNHE